MARLLARIAIAAGLLIDGVLAEPVAAADPLSASIDVAVEQAAVGPLAPPCTDGDFVRRIHLDLTGVIPTPERVRAFLGDASHDRRERLVDELIAGRGFVRQMGFVLDAMLLERTRPPGSLPQAWQAWLRDAVASEIPLDELFGKVVAAEGGDPVANPAAAFLLAREAEPVKMTRAVGRIVFGRELQCAQCHDHPLDDDIRQAEFHGLHAFVKRTSLFTAGDAQQLSEAAAGEVDYASVFTDASAKGVWPQMPDGPPLIDEPVAEPGDGYVTAPSNASRGVPSFSRRQALADRLATSDTFRRNLANRIWAVFFGQGLVHPLDGLGPANPPSHPQLLTRLVEALVEHDYQLRPIVRGIVLSRAYQRSVEPPRPADVDLAAVAALMPQLETRQQELAGLVDQRSLAAEAAESRRQAAFDAERAIHEELQPAIATRAEARQAYDAAAKAASDAEATRDKAVAAAEAVRTAATNARRAAELLGGDDAVAAVVATLEEQLPSRDEATQAASVAVNEKAAARAAVEPQLASTRAAFDEVAARRSPATLADLTREADDAERALVETRHEIDRLAWRLQLARDLLSHAAVAEADSADARTRWASIEARWNESLQVGRLRPLSPDQLALSFLQATGGLARLEAEATTAIDKEPPPAVSEAAEADREATRVQAIERVLLEKVGGLQGTFVSLYGDPLLEGFQASLGQALYLGNAPQVAGELKPAGENLAARLLAIDDAAAVADEACLAVFSRPADEGERADIAAFLTERTSDRPEAIGELIWALLASNEFRFHH